MIPFVAVIVFLAQTAVGSRLEDSNGSHGSARRPNVILMVVDDSGFGDFGCVVPLHCSCKSSLGSRLSMPSSFVCNLDIQYHILTQMLRKLDVPHSCH